MSDWVARDVRSTDWGEAMNFDRAFDLLIGHEGGYVNNPKDPGGETKFGISKRSYPYVDIKNLTAPYAKAIYKEDFWDKACCDKVPGGMAFDLFDTAVNSGVKRAVMMLQSSLGVAADGDVGPVTLAALAEVKDPSALQARFNGRRLQFMTDLSTWGEFGKGWARRIAANLKAIGD